MTYYIEQENKIVLHDTDRVRLERTLKYMPQFASLPIQITERPIENCEWADTEEYIQKKHLQEVENQVDLLENTTGLNRALREIVLLDTVGVSAYVKDKAQEIETLAEELRG